MILNPTSISNKTFRRYIIRFLPVLAACFLVSGCAALRPSTPHVSSDSLADKGGNAYYNFIRSEMEIRNGEKDQAIGFMEKAVTEKPDSIYLKKELIYLYLQSDNTNKALETTEAILADHPDDIGSLIIAGTIKKQLGREEEAAAMFERVLSLKPDQEKIYHVLGEYYLGNKAFEKAAEVYRQMTEQFPEKWEGFFFLGKIQARLKNYAEAEKNFRHCLELDKNLASPRFELIELYKQKAAQANEVTVQPGDTLSSLCRQYYQNCDKTLINKISAANPDITDINALKAGQKLILPDSAQSCGPACRQQIIDLYKSILDTYPDNYRAILEFALFHYSIGNSQTADALLADLARKSENDTKQLMQYISQLFISRQRYDDARTLLLGLLRGAPPESDLHYLLGVIYDKQQQPNEALRQFSEVAEDSAFYTSAMMQMAFLYEETEQPDKTKALFDRLLEEEPDNIELLLYAGSFLERQEQYKQAEALYLRGIEIEPRNVDLLFRLGVVYDKTGRKEAVIKQMKDILEIAPDDANALNYLGYTYADMGINLDEARQLIEKALQIEPDNGYITDSLGWVYYQKGDYDKAIALLIRAVELSPDDSILLEHLGDAYRQKGDTEKALDAYRRSLEFAPEESRDKINNKIQELLQPVDKP